MVGRAPGSSLTSWVTSGKLFPLNSLASSSIKWEGDVWETWHVAVRMSWLVAIVHCDCELGWSGTVQEVRFQLGLDEGLDCG